MKKCNILLLLMFILFFIYGCTANSQKIVLNRMSGHVDYIHFVNQDTGFVITHQGDIYDISHKTYIYRTTNAGTDWSIVDSIIDFSFFPHAHINITDNVLLGYVFDGTQFEGHWNLYPCYINFQYLRHSINFDAIQGCGKYYIKNDSVFSYVYYHHRHYVQYFDYLSNSSFIVRKQIHSIKDIAFNDSSYACITYDNILCYNDTDTIRCFYNSLSEIISHRENYYISFYGDRNLHAGIYQYSPQSQLISKINYPDNYAIVKFVKRVNDQSLIITFAKKEISSEYDVIYSYNEGQTWNTIHVNEYPILTNNSLYCKPYLFFQSSKNEITKLYIPCHDKSAYLQESASTSDL